ncbi:MAG: S41 family peptidase [Planctomycetaceae bacterium]
MPVLPRLRSSLFTLVIGLWVAFAFSAGFAGSQSAERFPGDVRQAVNSGVELETTRKWLDAILHYEKAVKSWPESKELEYGLRRSRIHFAIERRYSDKSFKKSLLGLSQGEALALFDDVLDTVQRQYVEPISPTEFISHGTESLYHALADERFLESNVATRLRSNAPRVRETLYREYWNKPVGNRNDAQSLVLRISQLAQDKLGLKPTAVILEYAFGGCNVLDDYSSMLTPGRLTDLHSNIDGQFVGLGVEIRSEPGEGLLLVNVLPESPAASGGLLPGEHIVGIDGANVRHMTTDEAAGMLQGLDGSRVTVEVQSVGGATRRLSLVRRAVVVKSIPVAKIIDRDQGIGYIQMTGFQRSTVKELDAALYSLRQQGMRSLIWDLRGNPGGLLPTAVEVADRFIADGVIVSTRGRSMEDNNSYSAHRNGTTSMPLVLLIDGDSASASEIIAGAVKDHRRGTIVGRRSYGKWSVQSIHQMRDNCGLRLTTAKFYSPAGHTLGKIGVRPDIEVPEVEERQRAHYRALGELDSDLDVQKGLEVLRRQTASR